VPPDLKAFLLRVVSRPSFEFLSTFNGETLAP
jgi:hypothetical protein